MSADVAPRPALGKQLWLEQVAIPFGDGRGIADLSLTVAAGERVVVLGPSGAGKTTLLRAVAGLARMDAGRVQVGGEDVTALAPERRGIVYLHQSPLLFSHLSVAENVAFPLRVRGQRGDAVRQRVEQALVAVRLDGFGQRATSTLSGGQRHRVALARAIAARPAALLLDEPLSALDPTLRDEVRAAIVAAQGEYGPAMMLVTHDLDDAGLLADRIAVLLDGRVAQLSAPAELFAHPATLAVARFLGLFQELPGQVRADGAVDCVLGVVSGASLPATMTAGAPVTIAVRADALSIRPGGEGAVVGQVVAVRHRARESGAIVRLAEGRSGVEVEAALRPAAPIPSIGERVAVSIDPRSVVIFPR